MGYEPQNDRDVEMIEVGGTLVSIEAGQAQSIALDRLHLSSRNVRRMRDPEGIPALAAMILAAGGLLHSLSVVPENVGRGKAGDYGVVAGGRRLAALQYLAKKGEIANDELIPCRVFNLTDGVGISLTENASQEVMHPADQLEAFKRLRAEGKTAGQIAAAFGVSELTVERRLKLAGLAPEFIELFRKGEIDGKQMQALALTDDHAEQRRAWEALPNYQRSAHFIREILTRAEVRADAPRARFVGLEAYMAAGGAVRRDLFCDDGEGVYLQDDALLARLAREKLQPCAEALRAAGWKWVEVRNSFSHSDRAEFSQLLPTSKMTGEEETAVDELRQWVNTLERLIDEIEEGGTSDADVSALEEQHGALNEIIEAMEEAAQEWMPEQKSMSGVVLTIDAEGRAATVCGLVKREDRAEAGKVLGKGTVPGGAAKPKERAEYSAALCRNLTAHRAAAVGAALTQNPKVALAALVMTLILDAGQPWRQSPVKFRYINNTHHIESQASEFADTRARELLERAGALCGEFPGEPAALWDVLQEKDLSQLVELLAVFVARSYDVFSDVPDPNTMVSPIGRLIESALALDMAEWWQPTPERYLKHVSKAKMMEAVTEACGPTAAASLGALKKADAVAAAADALNGRGWLPTTLRAYAEPADAGEADDDEGEVVDS